MPQPHHGDRVYVRPTRPQEHVQRGAGLHGQFLPAEGMDCTWDSFLQDRLNDGSIVLCDPPAPQEHHDAES